MPRLARVVAVGAAHHVTQRGNARRTVFETDSDRLVYLSLVSEFSRVRKLAVVGYCLMPNHVHLVVIPQVLDAMALALRDVHGRYAAYLNSRHAATGHVWQGRFYSCPMDENYLWTALRYVERNPVRAGLVRRAEDYPWSSARTHCDDRIPDGILELDEWRLRWTAREWHDFLDWSANDGPEAALVRRSTHSGRPLGSPMFVERLEREVGRPLLVRKGGRPVKAGAAAHQPECLVLGP